MSTQTDIVIFGAGGHARECAWTASEVGHTVRCFIERPDAPDFGTQVRGIPVISLEEAQARYMGASAVIGLGNGTLRQKIANEAQGFVWTTLCHPAATMAPETQIGAGSVVFAGCTISVDVRIGRHVILNTAASVSHDGVIGDYVNISPGVCLAGAVLVGDRAFIGIGASISNGTLDTPITIGPDAVIGAGAVVLRNVAPGVHAVGSPAQPLTERHNRAGQDATYQNLQSEPS